MTPHLSIVDIADIHNTAEEIAENLIHVSRVLSALSDEAPAPLESYLKSVSLACEHLIDRAISIKGFTQ